MYLFIDDRVIFAYMFNNITSLRNNFGFLNGVEPAYKNNINNPVQILKYISA